MSFWLVFAYKAPYLRGCFKGKLESIVGISVIRMAIKNTKTMIDCQRLILSPMIQKNVQNVSMLKSKKMA